MKIIRQKQCVTYAFEGELDNYQIQQIKELCRYDIDVTRPKTVRLDFRKVTFIDSTGLGFVLARYKQVQQYGGELRLCRLSEAVRKVFTISGVFTIIPVEEEQKEAVR